MRLNAPGLTARESEIMNLVGEGLDGREIGRLLGISHRTVEIHRGKAIHKLHARNCAHAVLLLDRARLQREVASRLVHEKGPDSALSSQRANSAFKFLEEAVTLVRAIPDFPVETVREICERPPQEEVLGDTGRVGPLMVALASLCNAMGVSMNRETELELERMSAIKA